MYGSLGSDNIWPRYNYPENLESEGARKWKTEKIAFTAVQMKSLAMHITKLKFMKFKYIYGRKCTECLPGIWCLLNILIIFGIKEKSILLTLYNAFLAIATYIPQRLETGFVVQGHKCQMKELKYNRRNRFT